MNLTMLWTLVFCIHAAFAVDQSLLDSFKTVKEKFLQAQDALGQFETLLRETGITLPGLEEEYRILETMNAWSRMSTWTRPETSSDQSTKAASEEVEKVDRKQPNSLRNIRIGKTTIKIYKDTTNNKMVISMKSRTYVEFPLFLLRVKLYSTTIRLLPGMCGKGLCFVAEKNGDDWLLIVAADVTSVSGLIPIWIYLSQTDWIALYIDNIDSLSNDTLLTYHFQEFQVHNEEYDHVILEPHDSQINLHTTINLGVTKDMNSSNKTFIHPNIFYESGTHNESYSEYVNQKVNSTFKDGKYQAVAQFDLNPDKPMDGVVNFAQEIGITNDIHLYIVKQYTVFPKGQEDSIYFLNKAIVGFDLVNDQGFLQANSPNALHFGIFGAPTDILIRKHLKTEISNDFPGFDFLITRYTKGIVSVALTSYNVTLEDAGTYEIMAYFADGKFRKYIFKVHVVQKKIRIEDFTITHYVTEIIDGIYNTTIGFTCTASGNPLDDVYFVNRISTDNTSSSFRDIKLENNATVKITPIEVNDDTMSRNMTIYYNLTESFDYKIGCKASSQEQESDLFIWF